MSEAASEETGGTILFVDDEANILKSLKREFAETDYEVRTADSAAEGLKALEGENIDVVISDYKMPGMDGIAFLKIVMKQFPSVGRIILSGFADQYAVLKALSSGLVGTYITKPWDTEAIQAKVRHLFKIRQALKGIQVLKAVNSIDELPTLPGIYREFVAAVEAESPYGELASIITRDIASTTKVLRLANSAYYHLEKDISVERALSYMGSNAIRQILLFTSIADGEHWDGARQACLQNISTHSVLVNYGMGELYQIRSGHALPEYYTSACITHDIGKIIISEYLPDRHEAITSYMKDNRGAGFYESELALGLEHATHAEIGAFFLDLWGLPGGSIEAALYHHDLKGPHEGVQDVLEACQTANLLSNYIMSHPDETGEALPAFLTGYGDKGALVELVARLRESHARMSP